MCKTQTLAQFTQVPHYRDVLIAVRPYIGSATILAWKKAKSPLAKALVMEQVWQTMDHQAPPHTHFGIRFNTITRRFVLGFWH